MLKLCILLIFASAIFFQAVPAFCGPSRTAVFHLSVTIPAHVIATSDPIANPLAYNPYQMVQIQTVVRNNRAIRLASIVVP